MAHCDDRSVRQRAIALLLPALVFGGPSAGCRVIQSPPLRPPSAPSPSRYEAGRGGERDDVEPAQYVPSSEATPSRDPPPEADSVESEASFSLAEAIAYGLRHNPRLQQTSAQVAESLEDCLRRAAALRPEIGAARQEIAGAAEGERSARGEMLPRIYTRGTVIQAELPRVFHGWIDGAGVHAEQPLYAGGSKRAALRRAHAERDAATAGLKVILNNVSAQVNLSYNSIATDRERIRLNSVAAGQARENLRVVVVRYNNGDAIPTEVVDAQTALTTAEVRYYASVYSYLAGLSRLEYAQGGDLRELLARVSQPPEADDQRIDLPRDPDKPPSAAPLTPPSRAPAAGVDLPPALPDRP
jgi:Outer membrane efflux protein